MATATALRRFTGDEFAAMSNEGFELVDGQLVELQMSLPSSWTAGEIYAELRQYARQHNLGEAYPPEAGIRCFRDDPHRVRKPDAFFVRAERLDAKSMSAAFLPFAPDLVVEVVSPTDLSDEVIHKVREYQSAGVPLIWVVHPTERIAHVYRLSNECPVSLVPEDGYLDGEDVIQGFRCRLADVLPRPRE